MSKEEKADLIAKKLVRYTETRERIDNARIKIGELIEYTQQAESALSVLKNGLRVKELDEVNYQLGSMDEEGYRELVDGIAKDRATLLSLHDALKGANLPFEELEVKYGGRPTPPKLSPRNRR